MASRPTASRDAAADPLVKATQLGVSGSNGRAGERGRGGEGDNGVGVGGGSSGGGGGGGGGMRKRKNHRGGKKKRHKSFAAVSSSGGRNGEEDEDDLRLDPASAASRDGLYDRGGHSRSSASIESETLLDHRDAPFLRPRRPSLATPTARQSGPFSFAQQQSPTRLRAPPPVFGGDSDDEDRGASSWNEGAPLLSRSMMLRSGGFDIFPSGHGGASGRDYGSIHNASGSNANNNSNHVGNGNGNGNDRKNQKHGRRNSSRSSHRHRFLNPFSASQESYNVNYPPSVPGSPSQPPKDRLDHIDLSFGDEMLRDELSLSPSLPRRATSGVDGGGAVGSGSGGGAGGGTVNQDSVSSPLSQQRLQTPLTRRQTAAAEADVCFPQGAMSDLGEEDDRQRQSGGGDGVAGSSGSGGSGGSGGGGGGGGGAGGGMGDGGIEEDYFSSQRPSRGARRHRRKWPDLVILNEWSRLEKEGHNEERRAKKITEPQLVNGRLRPVHKGWHRAEEDAPYRFTYFNEEFQSTIHSQTISELVQPGGSFRELFVPDPPLLSDSESDEDGDAEGEMEDEYEEVEVVAGADLSSLPSPILAPARPEPIVFLNGEGGPAIESPPRIKSPPPQIRSPPPPQIKSPRLAGSPAQRERDIQTVMAAEAAAAKPAKAPRYGERPVWWLDVLSPTEAEMKVLSKTFGIHPLTAEDIIMQETREKVELFRNYYFVSYRSFDQDPNSDTFLDPVNMYVVVFREGVLSFHFSMTPHPANVRRRIRQLRDYMMLSSDWVSYAIIDDITDVFLPLIQKIEEEVDDIDDAILKMHEEGAGNKSSSATETSASPTTSKRKDKHEKPAGEASNAGAADGSGPSASTSVSDSNMLRHVGDCRKRVMSLYRLLGNKADVIKGFAKRCNEHWEVAPRSEIGLYLGDIQDHIVTMTGNLSHYEKILSRAHGNYLAQINIRMNERQEQTADVLGKLTVLGTIIVPMNIITGLWGMNVWVPGQSYEGDLKYFFLITGFLLLFGIFCYVLAKRVYKIV